MGTVVGLDFGSGVIRAVEVADGAKAKPKILRYASQEVPVSALEKGEVVEPQVVATALKQLWKTAKFKTKKVLLGIGNLDVVVRELTVAKETPARLKESLPYQAQEIIPVPVDEAVLDFYPLTEEERPSGPVLHGLLVAAVKESVLKNVDAVSSAGLSVVGVDLIPFALGRVLVGQGEGVAAVVEVGAEITSITVIDEGVPNFVRIIETGGNEVNEQLIRLVGVDPNTAELFKRRFGLASGGFPAEARPAVDIIFKVTSDLFRSVENTLSYYQSTHPTRQIQRVVLSGGGTRLVGFAESLRDVVRLPVEFGNAFRRFALPGSASADDLVSLPVAAGLTLGSKA